MCLLLIRRTSPVVHGRLARHTKTAPDAGAVLVGETAQVSHLAETVITRSNVSALLDDLQLFFRVNPTWE
jgi:hypothetical protein